MDCLFIRRGLLPVLVALIALIGLTLGCASEETTDDDEMANDAPEMMEDEPETTYTGPVDFPGVESAGRMQSVHHEAAKVHFEFPAAWELPYFEAQDFWEWPLLIDTGDVTVTVYRATGTSGLVLSREEALERHRVLLENTYDVEDVTVPLVFEQRDPSAVTLGVESETGEDEDVDADPRADPVLVARDRILNEDYEGGPLPTSVDRDLDFPLNLVWGRRHTELAGRDRIGLYGEFARTGRRYYAFIEVIGTSDRTVVVSYVFEKSEFPVLRQAFKTFRERFRLIGSTSGTGTGT